MKRLLYWIPALVWASLLFFLSSQSTLPGGDTVPDYLSHYSAYFILAICCALGFAGRIPVGQSSAVYVLSWILAALYGLSDEWHQMFIPGRTPSWTDVLADALGALTAVMLLVLIGPVFRNQKNGKIGA